MDADLLETIIDPEMGGCTIAYGRITETINNKGRNELHEAMCQAEGNIQPAPGEEREVLEDADRYKECLLIFTPAPLTAGQGDLKADRVYHNGNAYRVVSAEPWQHHAGFTKALAVFERVGAP